MVESTLHALLDDNVRFDAAGRGTVNHLPMALFALSRLGADDRRLAEYFAWWEVNKALPRRDSGWDVERGGWARHIADAAMFGPLATCFRSWVGERGSAEVIGSAYPILANGVAAAAFHGLIRLAYGIEANHPGEISAGLAMLTARYVELGIDIDRAPPAASVEAAFTRLSEALGGAVFTGQGIVGKMQAAAADKRFRAGFSRPPIGPALLGEVARTAIALYWQAADFTVLHMVTASHAARVLFGALPQLASPDAVKPLWLAVCAAYASVGAPPLPQIPVPEAGPDWPEIFARAIACNDDHVIKMVYTCRCEASHYRNPLYRAAAARLAAAGKSI